MLGYLRIEHWIDPRENARHCRAPLLVERIPVQKIDLLQRELPLRPGLLGDAHLALDVTHPGKQSLDFSRVRAIQQREETLEVTLLGGKQQIPIFHLIEAEGRKGYRQTVNYASVHQPLHHSNSRMALPVTPPNLMPRSSAA